MAFPLRIFVPLVLLVVPGCGRSDAPVASSPPSASSARAVRLHPDRLAPGELAPGKDVAFGLTLPRALRVYLRDPFAIHAEGRVEAERVSNYVRHQVKAQSIEVGAAKTIFNQARVEGAAAPSKPLRIEVLKLDQGTRLVVVDLTPRKVDPSLKPDDLWRIHGFDKDGKHMDPARFE